VREKAREKKEAAVSRRGRREQNKVSEAGGS